jgi:hypothetical protein
MNFPSPCTNITQVTIHKRPPTGFLVRINRHPASESSAVSRLELAEIGTVSESSSEGNIFI